VSHFSDVLKGLRKKAGFSQRELAERAGLSQKAVSFWELGEAEPTISNLQKLCTALGVGCEVFFDGQKPPAPKKAKRK
jgi:transcriptional regulator with XRE-family HTH domain